MKGKDIDHRAQKLTTFDTWKKNTNSESEWIGSHGMVTWNVNPDVPIELFNEQIRTPSRGCTLQVWPLSSVPKASLISSLVLFIAGPHTAPQTAGR